MKITTLAALVCTFSIAAESSQAQSINFPDYFPVDAGYSWKGVAPACNDWCACPSIQTLDVTATSPLGPNAYVVGSDASNGWVVENTGASFLLYGYLDQGVFYSPPGGTVTLGSIPDGYVFEVEPGIFVLVRDWDSITHQDKALYGVDQPSDDLVAWAWYDVNYVTPNPHDVVFESGLPTGSVPPTGNITDIDWFLKDEGFRAQDGVDAATGDPWPPAIDIRFTASLDCNGNGVIDRLDILGGEPDLNGDCIPDSCVPPGTPYCFGDGGGTVCPCGNNGNPGEGCANSTGAGGIITASGSDSVTANDLVLHTGQLIPGQAVLGFTGTTGISGGNGTVLGDGLRCVGGQIKRLGVRIPNSNGSASWGPGFVGAQGWSAGDTRTFQAWYRDSSGSPCNSAFNLTNGLRVTLTP